MIYAGSLAAFAENCLQSLSGLASAMEFHRERHCFESRVSGSFCLGQNGSSTSLEISFAHLHEKLFLSGGVSQEPLWPC